MLAHEFDGLHDIFMGYVVGVEQAEHHITTGGLISSEHLNRPIRIPAHASVGVEQIVHGQVIDRAVLDTIRCRTEIVVGTEFLFHLAQPLSLNPPIGCWRAWVAGLMPGWGRVGPSGVCWGVWGWGWGAFWVVDAGFVWGRQFRGVSFSLRVRAGLAGRGAWL